MAQVRSESTMPPQLINTQRIGRTSARQLVHEDVMRPVKGALEQVEQIRFVLENRKSQGRAIPRSGDPLLARIIEAKTAVEASVENFRRYAIKVIEQNWRLKIIWVTLGVALFAVGLFGLVWGVVRNAPLILGGSAIFIGTTVFWPYNNLRRIRSEEIEIQTLPDRVLAGIHSCMAKPVIEEIAGCFEQNLKLLDQTYERLREKIAA